MLAMASLPSRTFCSEWMYCGTPKISAGLPKPAREPRAVPRMSERFESYHDAIFRMMMLPAVLNGN